MRQLLILFTLLTLQTSQAANSIKVSPKLSLEKGARWKLIENLSLHKTGLTPEEFVPYTNIWNLKSHSFNRDGGSSTDSCEFRTTVSKKTTKQTSLQIKKASGFLLTNIQESPMSIMLDITSDEPKKAGIDQIQITCSAYEQGLDSPELKQKFKETLSASLIRIFKPKQP